MGHTSAQELLGARALNALESDEAEAVDLHVEDCPLCRHELQEYVEAAALLVVGSGEAPPAVWERIQANLVEPPRQLDQARARKMQASPLRTRGLQVMAVAAAVLSLFGVYVAIDGRQRDGQSNIAASLLDASRDPAARKVELVAQDGTTRGEVVLLRGQGWLAEDALPPLDEGKTYQLWGLRAGKPVSLGTAGRDPGVVTFAVAEDFDAIAITAEREPGEVSPTLPPIASGTV